MEREGIGLCLSGGGYRAMVFHIGVLWRLNELGTLPRLRVVSSVSSGAIAAGVLAHAWPRLEFDDDGVAQAFADEFVRPVRATASRTVDAWALLRGLLNPWRTISDQFAAILRRRLFGDRTLDQLPTTPTFDFNATNLRNGARWLLSQAWMGDEHTGWVSDPQWPLATAVAAASAFPPFLSPLMLQLPDGDKPVLTDGGVFDDLSMEYVIDRCATVLVSDGGSPMEHASKVPRIWLGQTMRVLEVIDNRMRELRRRRLLDYFQNGEFDGAYWGAYSDIADFDVPDALDAPYEQTVELAKVPGRLKALPARTQEQLINWGYAVADASMRRWFMPAAPPPKRFPYPEAGVG